MSDVWLPTMELDDGGDYQSLVDENDALRAENDRLHAQVAGLTAALEWYADPANWDEDGYAMDNLRGGYHTVDEWVDFDFDLDVGARARAALPAPNPGLPISPVVPNPGLSVSPAPPTEGGESS